ncbi:hypothetical protein SLEP1_g34095 [Rubroshorea leprosula]|uniref:WRKY domain-containing protein n=1 Tax=Rubroshorea leprosula TaxID=152421 RepID=A0AAV5KIR0_9ROSI|nr:hypothetical protein SLEP1_g34095 [Rubroshorea leprosula]
MEMTPNSEPPEGCLMFDGRREDYQPAAIDSGFSGNPVNQVNTFNETGGISSFREGPNNRESKGGRMEKEVKERIAFRTWSDCDILEDGYEWRKYGTKTVLNSPYPR